MISSPAEATWNSKVRLVLVFLHADSVLQLLLTAFGRMPVSALADADAVWQGGSLHGACGACR